MMKKYSLEFGKKEKVLNYACQTYELSRPNKVGTVMALIRQCQPKTIEDWEIDQFVRPRRWRHPRWGSDRSWTGCRHPWKAD